jgi:hypothetical protein
MCQRSTARAQPVRERGGRRFATICRSRIPALRLLTDTGRTREWEGALGPASSQQPAARSQHLRSFPPLQNTVAQNSAMMDNLSAKPAGPDGVALATRVDVALLPAPSCHATPNVSLGVYRLQGCCGLLLTFCGLPFLPCRLQSEDEICPNTSRQRHQPCALPQWRWQPLPNPDV